MGTRRNDSRRCGVAVATNWARLKTGQHEQLRSRRYNSLGVTPSDSSCLVYEAREAS